MKKSWIAALSLAALACLLCLWPRDPEPREVRFSVETGERGGTLLVSTGSASAQVGVCNLSDGATSWRCGANLSIPLAARSRYAVVVRSPRPARWSLRDGSEGCKISGRFNKKVLKSELLRGIMDELNSGGPLPQVGYERPCEEGEQSQ